MLPNVLEIMDRKPKTSYIFQEIATQRQKDPLQQTEPVLCLFLTLHGRNSSTEGSLLDFLYVSASRSRENMPLFNAGTTSHLTI